MVHFVYIIISMLLVYPSHSIYSILNGLCARLTLQTSRTMIIIERVLCQNTWLDECTDRRVFLLQRIGAQRYGPPSKQGNELSVPKRHASHGRAGSTRRLTVMGSTVRIHRIQKGRSYQQVHCQPAWSTYFWKRVIDTESHFSFKEIQFTSWKCVGGCDFIGWDLRILLFCPSLL